MKKLNSNHLKLIAIIAMTIDHIADLIYPGMPNNIIPIILHIIGRLTAPIMFFFICYPPQISIRRFSISCPNEA